jgi:hypothetical protein
MVAQYSQISVLPPCMNGETTGLEPMRLRVSSTEIENLGHG